MINGFCKLCLEAQTDLSAIVVYSAGEKRIFRKLWHLQEARYGTKSLKNLKWHKRFIISRSTQVNILPHSRTVVMTQWFILLARVWGPLGRSCFEWQWISSVESLCWWGCGERLVGVGPILGFPFREACLFGARRVWGVSWDLYHLEGNPPHKHE